MSKWIALFSCLFAISPLFAQEPDVAEVAGTEVTEAQEAVSTPEGSASEADTAVVAEPAETEAPAAAVEETPAPRTTPVFVVILPERIDHDWYWFMYSDREQHIVQSAIEKALIRAGLDVIDLQTVTMPSFGNDIMQLQSTSYALKAGRQLQADYVISGQATAVKASEGTAYGVNVVRTQAEITAKIIRVSDGKIIEVEDASLLEGGQSSQAAGQSALKKAGTQVASKLVRTASKLTVPETSAK